MNARDPKAPKPDSRGVVDSVDRQVASWRAKRPDLDFSALDIMLRLGRLQRHFHAGVDAVFARHGLSGPGFAVLATLVRLEERGSVSQRRLMDELALTAGTISVRIDRLETQGLVEREADPADKRSTFIRLTSRGRELFERITPEHLDNQRRLLAALDATEQARLAEFLAKLVVEFEGSIPGDDKPLLGLVLAPAHIAIEMRATVGLPGEPRLLVYSVREGGVAAQAGIRPGDLLIRAAGHELRSISSLYDALREAAGQGDNLYLHVLRATDAVDVVVKLPAIHAKPFGAVTRGRVGHFEHLV